MGFHGRLSSNETREISRFCSFCSENGCYCDIAEAPFEERKRLNSIKDQMKEVENKLMFLQRMSSWQQMDRQAAFNSLEESRRNIVAKVTEYKGRRELDVVTELSACFGSENNVPFNWDFRERLKKKAYEPADGVYSRRFLTNCIRKMIISWKWKKVYGIAVKLVMVSVSISSVIAAYKTRQLLYTSSRKMIPPLVSKAGKSGSLLTFSKNPLNVFFGRG